LSGRGSWPTLAWLAVALAVAIAVRLGVAPGGWSWPDDAVIWELRLLRVAIAAIVGAGLAVSGALLQTILRNDLASPFVLGLTSGAGLGIVVWTWVGYVVAGTIVTHEPPVLATVVGAFGAMALVYALGQRRGLIDPGTLILVGVVVGVICAALTTFFQHLLPDRGMAVHTRWVMGNLREDTPWSRVALIGSITLVGGAIAWSLGRSLDAATLGDDEAASVGVSLGRLRAWSVGVSGVLTAGTVALAGPIGFVGLIAPHVARRIVGAAHRPLLLGSALVGATLVVAADVVATLPELPGGRMPVGVVTALAGGPVFLWLARKGLRS
jgi:iron complex transport system permease protein